MESNLDIDNRRHWMSALAKAPEADLEKAWAEMAPQPEYRLLRSPETGLVLVRGRAGGTGAPFHLGEIAVTRCTLVTEKGYLGTAYILGRAHRHAELAAVFDALIQDEEFASGILERVVEPLEEEYKARAEQEHRKTKQTQVDFFTMVRGE